jgi:hypothetical protein
MLFLGDVLMVTRRNFLVAVGLITIPGGQSMAAGEAQKSKPKLTTVTLTIDGMT